VNLWYSHGNHYDNVYTREEFDRLRIAQGTSLIAVDLSVCTLLCTVYPMRWLD
jgi:hypothetical protein